ncbi:immunoglobulin-like domain-containing protein [uncultured Aquimarina sp.]|uniref:beta strand repeat-containing protein n=1 Tax=uncultured Aquimarina sp. TaxID=575652 RepID=UPI00260359EF|nr:immunoglobulin-like domain-containing protein [uncultured Aquimarina sp.]
MMKKITFLIICFLLTAMVGAQDITFTFQNARNTNDGTDDFYEADIYIESSTDFKLGSGQIYFTYNTAAFGENIDGSGNFEYLQPDGSILAETYSGFPAYSSFIANDNTNSRVSASFQQGLSSGTITANNVTSTPKHLFSIKIKYEDTNEEPTVAFETGAVFLDQFFTACGPATFGLPDCTNNPGVQINNDTFDSSEATPDTTAPVISLNGDIAVTVEAATTYSDAGATALDDRDADITADIVTVNPVDTAIPGVYTVTYNVSDAAGNDAVEVTREVTVVDTTVPVISLAGDTTVTVEAGSTYTDAEATASDSLDGDITADIVIVNPVDTSVPGIYTVTYNVSDAAGNDAVEVTREVTVSDTTIPVISLTGDAAMTVEAGTTYSDAGATAFDSFDGDITADIVTVNPVNTAVPGVYTITYNVSDTAGNNAVEVTREVTVSDTTIPVITITGDTAMTVEAGTTYSDSGATASDSFDGDITADIITINPVNTAIPGVYTVTYNVSDAAGNDAVEVTREVTVSDTTIPIIMLTGDAAMTVEAGTTYSDAGATAFDSLDGDITAKIVGVNPVNTNIPGVYTITYNVNDAAGNNAIQVTREVTVSDTTIPMISLTGGATITVEAGTTYSDAGATAFDSLDGDITADIVTVNPVNTTIPGVYTVTYNVSDAAGNNAIQVTREVTISDTTIPMISLTGDAAMTVEAGTTYSDTGATAFDSFDGDITAAIVTVNPVNTAIPGVYTITYNVSDVTGNNAVEVTREVTVVDTTIPVITRLGATTVTVEIGTTYSDAGATAFDSLDGDITAKIVTVNPVNTAIPGVYTITYNVSDTAGNNAVEVTREVTVVNTALPVIALIGDANVTVEAGTTYTDAGATANDATDGDITAAIVTVNPVDTTVPGVYTITYNVTNSAGNSATEVSREVTVVDTTLPIIALIGDNPIEVAQGEIYIDPGATAFDSLDGDITADIVTVNPVDTSLEGTYTITYNVMDAAGNTAAEVTRTVNVSALLNVEENEIENLKIYPNPTSDTLFISREVEKVIIYTITGQKILETNNNSIEMSSYRSGVYLVHIFTNKGNSVKRVMKR